MRDFNEYIKLSVGLTAISASEMPGAKKHNSDRPAESENNAPSVTIVPPGILLLAAAGPVSTIIDTRMSDIPAHNLFFTGVICTAVFLIFSLLRVTGKLSHAFSDRVTSMLNRLTGLILAASGVEFIICGRDNSYCKHPRATLTIINHKTVVDY